MGTGRLSTGSLKPLQSIAEHVSTVSDILDGVDHDQLTHDLLMKLQDSINHIDTAVDSGNFHKNLEKLEKTAGVNPSFSWSSMIGKKSRTCVTAVAGNRERSSQPDHYSVFS